MSLSIKILDYLIDLVECQEVIAQKNAAVRNQEFAEAAKLLEKQREIEGRLLTADQLRALRDELKK